MILIALLPSVQVVPSHGRSQWWYSDADLRARAGTNCEDATGAAGWDTHQSTQ